MGPIKYLSQKILIFVPNSEITPLWYVSATEGFVAYVASVRVLSCMGPIKYLSHKNSHFRSKLLKNTPLLWCFSNRSFVAYVARVRVLTCMGPIKYLPQKLSFYSPNLSDVLAMEVFVAFLVFWWTFSSCVFFIAGFVQLDIKVIVERAKNCMSSNHTFLSIARNGVFQFLILKQYEEGQKQAIIMFSISCNSQKCLIRKHAIFISCNYYLYV